jgi:hypothetical protein
MIWFGDASTGPLPNTESEHPETIAADNWPSQSDNAVSCRICEIPEQSGLLIYLITREAPRLKGGCPKSLDLTSFSILTQECVGLYGVIWVIKLIDRQQAPGRAL